MRKILLATRSAGKLRELRAMFSETGISVTDPGEMGIQETVAEEALEEFPTFEENAIAKARYFSEMSGGMPTVADDSGLVVDALGGLPGVRSKRWSGRPALTGQALDDANNHKLISELELIEQSSSGRVGNSRFPFPARYACVAAYVDHENEIVVQSETAGRIIRAPRGSDGFGYDPYFESDEVEGTFGEASLERKAEVSHRGRAFRSLLDALRERGLAG